MSSSELGEAYKAVRYIPLSYNPAESNTSALRLILTLFPEWGHPGGNVEFVRFTDGITNTLLKAVNKRPGLSDKQIDEEAVLLRAYGKGTDVLIDRKRESKSHCTLSHYNLAPPLLARFDNGLLYRFIRGRVCSPSDLGEEKVWRGVARRLGEWHGVLPVVSVDEEVVNENTRQGLLMQLSAQSPSETDLTNRQAISDISPCSVRPNIWTVMQKWIFALPSSTSEENLRRATLQRELRRLVRELGNTKGLGSGGLVFGHCDLLSGNVIVQPHTDGKPPTDNVETVSFIDYEYATPSPAAFDICNHFAEWGGFDCDYNLMPTRSVRRGFLREYLRSYKHHNRLHSATEGEDAEIQRLFEEVDLFRGVPGFYWGIWALIQATISQIDFDYAAYAEVRLGEYWAWRAEVEGTREAEGKEVPLREKKWSQEV
ncbi:hypothetical protein FGG08_006713 [Glutinoglossum americanum]|uniref:ethanolamine kinase n=1 Tax=Glutinoglossum americanum TaxID=1670608 RepID=A0A9P8HXR4_9PEZI|nr:hypothetical protein FGG08_006713 [Glutinoglossum americanum]